MLVNNAFGSKGLRGWGECHTPIPLMSCQDHKQVGDGDTGPNTSGIGAYSLAPVLTKELQSMVMESVILATLK